jgi:antitoxin MazE
MMEVSIIQIGNSKGLRLSKTVLEKYKIHESVEMILEEEQIVIRPLTKPRQGWGEAFKAMNANGDDKLMINDVFEDENQEEWK